MGAGCRSLIIFKSFVVLGVKIYVGDQVQPEYYFQIDIWKQAFFEKPEDIQKFLPRKG